jgi:hypothetical protein
MDCEVITVADKQIAESIAKGLRSWFESDPSVRETSQGWAVFVTGLVPENVRLLMNHYGLGVLDSKNGKV